MFPRYGYFLALLFCACSPRPAEETTTQDSTSSYSPVDSTLAPADSGIVLTNQKSFSADTSLTGIDTIYNTLGKTGSIRGSFVSFEFITTTFINVDRPVDETKTIAALLVTSEDEYQDDDPENDALTSFLVVLETDPSENYKIIDKLELGFTARQGLMRQEVEVNQLDLSVAASGVLVHIKTSEQGAGDYSYSKDDATLYGLKDGKIFSLLDVNLEDSWYSSNESDSWARQENVSELLTVNTGFGLFDLSITTSESYSKSDEAASDRPEERSSQEIIYRWNGSAYEQQEPVEEEYGD